MSTYIYNSLLRPQNVTSGIAEYALLAPVSWFKTIRSPKPPYIDPGDRVVIKDSHVFNDARSWVRYALAPEKNQFDATTTGDIGFQKFQKQLRIFIPGSYAEAHEAAAELLNTPIIVLSKDAECSANLFYQVGSKMCAAFLSCDFSTGTTIDGVKGYIATIISYNRSVLIYQGDAVPAQNLGLSSLFLASLSVNKISSSLTAARSAYNSKYTDDFTTIYETIVSVADENIIQIFVANNVDAFSEVLIKEADLTSANAFKGWLIDWLSMNGTGQSLQMVDGSLRVLDPGATESFVGICIPQNLLGDDDVILLADDDTLITVN